MTPLDKAAAQRTIKQSEGAGSLIQWTDSVGRGGGQLSGGRGGHHSEATK